MKLKKINGWREATHVIDKKGNSHEINHNFGAIQINGVTQPVKFWEDLGFEPYIEVHEHIYNFIELQGRPGNYESTDGKEKIMVYYYVGKPDELFMSIYDTQAVCIPITRLLSKKYREIEDEE